MDQKCYLDWISNDVLAIVLSFSFDGNVLLSFKQFYNLALTCKRFRQVLSETDEVIWKNQCIRWWKQNGFEAKYRFALESILVDAMSQGIPGWKWFARCIAHFDQSWTLSQGFCWRLAGDFLEIGEVSEETLNDKGIKVWHGTSCSIYYTGDFKKGVPQGTGIVVWNFGTSCDRYEGSFQGGARSGNGKLYWGASGCIYDGMFDNGSRSGKGSLRYPNGDVYEGQFLNGNMVGEGIEQLASGSKYVGDFSFGRKVRGELTFASGDTYTGEFLGRKFEGWGVLTYSDGKKYTGNWKQDLKHGHGTLTWPDGRKYEGYWSNDAADGMGTFYWSDNFTYSGRWKANTPLLYEEAIHPNVQMAMERKVCTAADHPMAQFLFKCGTCRDGRVYCTVCMEICHAASDEHEWLEFWTFGDAMCHCSKLECLAKGKQKRKTSILSVEESESSKKQKLVQ